jgi:hypothetical protein
MTNRLAIRTCCVAMALRLLSAPDVGAQATGKGLASSPNPLPVPLRLRAFAVNMSNIGSGQAGVVEFLINKWSTAAERQQVIETMMEKGQNQLLSFLQDLPSKGRLRFPNYMGPDPNNWRLGWDLRYTWTTPGADGGHRIVVALDRYMSFAEVRNQPRTVDYPFTLIEIHLNKDGEGQGKMAYATKITFDKEKNTVELENYSSEPVRLNTVKLEKG